MLPNAKIIFQGFSFWFRILGRHVPCHNIGNSNIRNGHIAYCRWKQERNRTNQVHSILNLNNEIQREAADHINNVNHLNNQIYNKVLLDVSHIVFLIIMTTLALFTRLGGEQLNNVEDSDKPHMIMSYVVIVIEELAVPIMLHFIFPILLHMSNPEARKFIFKQCCRRK